MTTPLACSLCSFWKRHRPDANWGECGGIPQLDPTNSTNQTGAELDGRLCTRDVFFCANFSPRPITHRNTVVDAAREAARSMMKPKEG
jgi:hypothetical protein